MNLGVLPRPRKSVHNPMPSNTMPESASQIGALLKQARAEAGLSQVVAAGRIGIDPVTLSRYEREVMLPPRTTRIALAQLYSKPATFFEEAAESLGEPNSEVLTRNDFAPTSVGGSGFVGEATLHPVGVDLPRALRLRENEVTRELIEAGATEEQVSDFRRSIRESPVLITFFRRGAPQRLTNDELLQLFDGVAIGFKAIIEQMIREQRESKRR